MPELLFSHCHNLPQCFLRDRAIKDMVLFYLVDSGEERACLIKGDDLTFLHLLKYATISDQNAILDSNIKDNGHNTRDGKSKRTRTRSHKHPNAPLDDPTEIAAGHAGVIEAEEEEPHGHHKKRKHYHCLYEIAGDCTADCLNPGLRVLLFVLAKFYVCAYFDQHTFLEDVLYLQQGIVLAVQDN